MTDKLFIERFIESASKNSGKTAICNSDGSTVSYKELLDASRKVARVIRLRGIQPKSPVIILLGRHSDYVACYLGVLMAGNVAIPLSSAFPKERVKEIAEDCNASYTISDYEEFIGPGSDDKKNVDIDHICISGTDPAVILYTSGSTGKPKGIVHDHNSVSAAAERSCELMEGFEDIRYSIMPAFQFAPFTSELFSVLQLGGTAFIIDDETRTDVKKLISFYRDNRIDVSFIPPQLLHIMRTIVPDEDFPVKRVLVGAERVINVYSPHFEIYNVYGMSETLAGISYFKIDKEYENVPVGKSYRNNSISIINDEICVKSYYARKYLNRDEESKKTFFPCEDGEVLVHTGDRGYLNENGDLVILGRMDFMIKINGNRVEPEEVENRMLMMPGIKEAVAIGVNVNGKDLLAAYYTTEEKKTVSTEQVSAFLKQYLPGYMIPSYITHLNSMPRNFNGKIDRSRLPSVLDGNNAASSAKDYTGPKNETQKKIYDCIKKLVGHDDFGIDTNLFEAGVTSIEAMMMTVSLSDMFGVPVRFGDIKDNPTVEKLEQFLTSATHGSAGTESFEKLSEYPLSMTQQGIFVETMAHPDTTIYNNPLLFELDPSIDEKKLKKAVVRMVDAHPFCKTRIGFTQEGDVVQKRMDDDTSFDENSIETICVDSEDEIRQKLVKPFKLTGDRLFRISIVHVMSKKTTAKRYFFLDYHHIISDGTSFRIILNDISAAYAGETLKKESLSGFDVVLLEQNRRKSDEYKKAKEFYRNLLDGVETACPIEGDILDKNPEEKAGTLCRISYNLQYSDAEKIAGFCKKNNIGLNGYFSACFGFLISVFSGKENFVFTSVYNGRNDSRLQNTLAMLVKTYPLCLSFDEKRSENVSDYVKAVADQITDHMRYDICSFAEISHDFGVSNDLLFVYQGDEFAFDTFCGKKTTFREEMEDQTKSALNAVVYLDRSSKSGIRVSFDFDASRFSKGFVQNLVESYDMILSTFTVAQTLADVKFLSEKQIQQLDSFNRTESDYEKSDIASLFVRQAKRVPDNTAVIFKDRSYTYAQVDEMSDRLAAFIGSKGVGAGDVVSVMIGRSEYMVIASLGVLKAGCAYQPLDPSYPKERLSFMVGDSKAKILIADEPNMELAKSVGKYDAGVLSVNDIPSLQKADFAGPKASNDSLFILLYTSGSTGTPKGVMLTHGNLVNFCHWYRTYYSLKDTSVVSSYASYGFDCCMMEMYPALTTGAAVCIVPEDIRLNLFEVNEYLKKNKVSHTFMTTQVGRQFATEVSGKKINYLTVAGETLVPVAPPEGFELHNGYGPTETTILSTIKHVDKDTVRVPIGVPLFNTKIYAIDKNGQRLPAGAIGELCISGHGVGRGYLNNPEKTTASFVKNPFTDASGYERMYRTGDLVRVLPDGDIDFLGRNDRQVKIRGFRIELSEIEEVVRRFPGVKDATVQAFEYEQGGGKFIAAYIVSDGETDCDKLREFIANEKPPYMVPASIMKIDAIPLNQNQKVNIKALPKPERKTSVPTAIVPVTSEKEIQIQKIWSQVLDINVDEIGTNSDFFELGGDSIRSIMLTVQYEKEFGVSITPTEFFKNRTLSSQLEMIEKGMKVSDIYVYNEDDTLPNVYFVHTGHTGGEAYVNLSLLLRSACSLRCFEPNNIFHQDNPIKGIKNLAARYIELLKEDQPEGPYILGGWSYGGMIAYEMACQLKKAGDEVGHLFLLDPEYMTSEREKELFAKVNNPDNFDDYLKKDPLFERFRQMGLLDKVEKNSKIVLDDMVSFVPEEYDGKVTFYKSERFGITDDSPEPDKELVDIVRNQTANGFENKVKNLKIIHINSEHDNFMKGYALYKIALNMEMTIAGMKKSAEK